MRLRKTLTILALCFSFGAESIAQDLSPDFKNWYITGFQMKLNPKSTLRLNHLNSFDTDDEGYKLNFTQSSLVWRQKFKKGWSADLGYAYSFIRGSRENTTYHRFQTAIRHKQKLGKIRVQHIAQLEKYTPTLQKFGARLVLSQRWYYYDRKLPLSFTPFVRNQVYYYQGGEPILYAVEAEEGEPAEEEIEQSANGWHRYRFTAGFRIKPVKPLSVVLFYTYQKEFNTGWNPYREINYQAPTSSKIKQPFNDYSLLGISLTYTLKMY